MIVLSSTTCMQAGFKQHEKEEARQRSFGELEMLETVTAGKEYVSLSLGALPLGFSAPCGLLIYAIKSGIHRAAGSKFQNKGMWKRADNQEEKLPP